MKARVFSAANGHTFIAEIADAVCAALVELGVDAERASGLPWPSPETLDIVVAPQELFGRLHGYDEATRLDAASHCVAITLEQPGTSWFERSATYAARSRLVLDVSETAAAELRKRGINASRLALGYHRSWDRWHGDAAVERPIDVVFLGSATRRRTAFFARHAALFKQLNCRLMLRDSSERMNEGDWVAGDEKYELLTRSKILLNLHRADSPYLEWNRVIQAMANGCLVVSEPSGDVAPLVPGQHFLEAPLDEIPGLMRALLADPASIARIARNGYEFISSEFTLASGLAPFLPAFEGVVREVRDFSPRPEPDAGTSRHGRVNAARIRGVNYARTMGPKRFVWRLLQVWKWLPRLLRSPRT